MEITVVGQRGFYLNGFTFFSPADRGLVEVPPRLKEGRYQVAGRGGFAPYGGPRGNLLITYRWPEPTPGLDAKIFVTMPAKEFRHEHTIVNPSTQQKLQIPAKTGAGDLRYSRQGLPGEFGGPPGDLLVHLELEGRRSTLGRTLLLVLAVAAVIWVVAQLLY